MLTRNRLPRRVVRKKGWAHERRELSIGRLFMACVSSRPIFGIVSSCQLGTVTPNIIVEYGCNPPLVVSNPFDRPQMILMKIMGCLAAEWS